MSAADPLPLIPEVDTAAAAALCETANELRSAGRISAAVDAFTRAIALDPGSATLWNDLGTTLMDAGRFDPAATAFVEATRLDPTLFAAFSNLGTCHHIRQKGVEAIRAYRAATRLDPQFLYARVQGMTVARETSDWEGWQEDVDALRRVTPAPNNTAPQMNLLYLALEPQQLRAHAEVFAAQWNRVAQHDPTPPRPASARIRLGLLSDDLRDHVVGWLSVEVLELIDRTKFDVHVFSWRPEDSSVVRRRLRRAGCQFHDISSASDEAAARIIARAGIDILVDLKGYTGGHRMGILARRSAPLQVTWLGYAGTTGASFIDYIIADDFVIPEGSESFYTESVLRLPDTFMPADRRRPISDHGNREFYGLPRDAIVLCYLGQSRKIMPETFADWIQVVKAVDSSVLWLRSDNPAARHNLRLEAAKRGLEPHRLIFVPQMSLRMSDYIARYRLADLALDTSPYGSHTTASDALWAGCPLLSLAGQTFASRVAGSLLRAVDLPELVTTSREDYRARAIDLAGDPTRLGDLRRRLQHAHTAGPLFDTPRFTRHLERALEGIHRRRLTGNSSSGRLVE